jgi:hypothetical protein
LRLPYRRSRAKKRKRSGAAPQYRIVLNTHIFYHRFHSIR